MGDCDVSILLYDCKTVVMGRASHHFAPNESWPVYLLYAGIETMGRVEKPCLFGQGSRDKRIPRDKERSGKFTLRTAQPLDVHPTVHAHTKAATREQYLSVRLHAVVDCHRDLGNDTARAPPSNFKHAGRRSVAASIVDSQHRVGYLLGEPSHQPLGRWFTNNGVDYEHFCRRIRRHSQNRPQFLN